MRRARRLSLTVAIGALTALAVWDAFWLSDLVVEHNPYRIWVPSGALSLKEAQKRTAFDIRLPGSLPAGTETEPLVSLGNGGDDGSAEDVLLYYNASKKGGLAMVLHEFETGAQPAEPGGDEALMVAGVRVALTLEPDEWMVGASWNHEGLGFNAVFMWGIGGEASLTWEAMRQQATDIVESVIRGSGERQQ